MWGIITAFGINISETKVKHNTNNEVLSSYYQVNQSKQRKGGSGMAKSKLVKANEKIAKGVVGSYKKMEEGVVEGFQKIADKFVDNFLTKEGESVKEARDRLAGEQRLREEGRDGIITGQDSKIGTGIERGIR